VDVTFLFSQKKSNQKKSRGCVFFYVSAVAVLCSVVAEKANAAFRGEV